MDIVLKTFHLYGRPIFLLKQPSLGSHLTESACYTLTSKVKIAA